MSLKDSKLAWPLAVLLAAGAGVEFGIVDVQFLKTNISPFATWIFVGSLMGAYLISQRDIGSLSDWEIGAFVIGLGSYFGITFIPEVENMISQYNPHAGVVLTLVVMTCFYILTNENI